MLQSCPSNPGIIRPIGELHLCEVPQYRPQRAQPLHPRYNIELGQWYDVEINGTFRRCNRHLRISAKTHAVQSVAVGHLVRLNGKVDCGDTSFVEEIVS